jgi:hypothetical protein
MYLPAKFHPGAYPTPSVTSTAIASRHPYSSVTHPVLPYLIFFSNTLQYFTTVYTILKQLGMTSNEFDFISTIYCVLLLLNQPKYFKLTSTRFHILLPKRLQTTSSRACYRLDGNLELRLLGKPFYVIMLVSQTSQASTRSASSLASLRPFSFLGLYFSCVTSTDQMKYLDDFCILISLQISAPAIAVS